MNPDVGIARAHRRLGYSFMFWGEYSHQLDDKGRLIIPIRYRSYLMPQAVLTRGLDHNLVIYPHETWRTLAENLNQMPITHPPARALRRLLFSGAVELLPFGFHFKHLREARQSSSSTSNQVLREAIIVVLLKGTRSTRKIYR